jgi:hypothetical protein
LNPGTHLGFTEILKAVTPLKEWRVGKTWKRRLARNRLALDRLVSLYAAGYWLSVIEPPGQARWSRYCKIAHADLVATHADFSGHAR